jgi:hypothetical protein
MHRNGRLCANPGSNALIDRADIHFALASRFAAPDGATQLETQLAQPQSESPTEVFRGVCALS